MNMWTALALLNFVLFLLPGGDNTTLAVCFWGSLIMSKVTES